MLYIKEQPKYWEIQRHFDDGEIQYNLINKTGLDIETRNDTLEMKNSNPTGGQIINLFNRFDILQPPALSDRALKVALLNPYMEGGGGTNSEYQTQYVIQSVVDFLDLFGANASKQITLPKATYLIDSVNLDMLDYTLISTEDITIRGFSQNINQITSTANGIDLITVNGANLFLDNIKIESSGTGSQAIVMTGTGVESLDAQYVEFIGATAWGTLTNLRQGFLVFSFAFGSTRGFLLQGSFGGFRIASSRLINVGQYILKGDSGFTCDAIRSDMFATIPTGAFAFNFDYDMFNTDGGYQLSGGRYDGDGEMVSNFTLGSGADNILAERSSRSFFTNNQGSKGRETVIGGEWVVAPDDSATTTISAINTPVKLAGVTTYSFLEHFSQTLDNEFVYSSSEQRRIKVEGNITIECRQDDTVQLSIQRFDFATSTWIVEKTYERLVLRLQGGRDIADFPISARMTVNQGDKISIYGANLSSTQNMTMEESSEIIITKL